MPRKTSQLQQQRRNDVVQRIKANVPLGDTSRKFHFALCNLVNDQLMTFHVTALQGGSFTEKQRVKVKLNEFQGHFKVILQRLSKTLSDYARQQRTCSNSPSIIQHCLITLQLDPTQTYTLQQVKKQFRLRAGACHPDHNGNNNNNNTNMEKATASMQDLNDAYAYLKEHLK